MIFPDTKNTTLLVVDIQERLLPAMGDERVAALVKSVDTLIDVAVTFGWKIVYTEQYPKGLGLTQSQLFESLSAAGADRYEKVEFSCCKNKAFAANAMPGLSNHVVVVGMESHICVLQTVVDLLGLGHQVYVPHDGVLSRTEANTENGLQLMERAGAVRTNMETLMFHALQKAGSDDFKRLSRRIR